MKRPVLTMKRSLVLTLAALSTLSALPAVGAAPVDAPQGKRVDNARLESRTLPPPAEWEPVAAYPLPSGVTREHAAALRRDRPLVRADRQLVLLGTRNAVLPAQVLRGL